MCTEAEGIDTSVSQVTGTNGIEHMVVTAPRVGLNMDVVSSIDWVEVGQLAGIGALAGAPSGIGQMAINAAAGTAVAVETMDGVDLEDLVNITSDIIVVPGVPGPYVPML